MNKFKFIITAKTLKERKDGLRPIKKLLYNEGALFIFPNETLSTFWNKGVGYPIDLGFFDKDKKLIFTATMDAEQTKPVGPNMPYRYVVETSKGMFKIYYNDIKELLNG